MSPSQGETLVCRESREPTSGITPHRHPGSRNHPKALRVISRYIEAGGDIEAGGVAITRRLCVSFQGNSSAAVRNIAQELQSPEGSACHFKCLEVQGNASDSRSCNHPKALRVISRKGRNIWGVGGLDELQSPEGSACHFKPVRDTRLHHAHQSCNHPKALRVISRMGKYVAWRI
mgnify:FL=1